MLCSLVTLELAAFLPSPVLPIPRFRALPESDWHSGISASDQIMGKSQTHHQHLGRYGGTLCLTMRQSCAEGLECLCEPAEGEGALNALSSSCFSAWIMDCLSSFTRKLARLGKFQQQKLQHSLIQPKMLRCRQNRAKMLSKTSSNKSKWITLGFYHSFKEWRMLLSKS